ncbi:Coenzyme F420 hydrogenase/dehydrogenase, beta subunit C-terminal domain [Oribacterium sp. NK2B42]|uniref:Coenzyme F420 hydrogenase/dehydrogenase, beta subunit C-terminal domain n=1 Tax=Oribacterium sp. NK2B42 TaxID=689781 RepID=UPI00040121D2|nr:Coenzyme F420 hydrogenase/dehydrogenase, beta subunit C-terminal domain [Oribacterium sp. NK2B42]
MIKIQRKEDCCGCTACVNACPVNCIQMQEDIEGFKYPHIDRERCVNCHNCEKVCPVINNPKNERKPVAYLARTRDIKLLSKCTSGGVFTELAREIVKNGGIAYGVVYGESFKIQHERISNLTEIERFPGSKYVQSDVGTTFAQVKNDLIAGNQVAFCGTPCQVAGLNNFLGKEYRNLLLVDLVCHGVPSPKLWRAYVDYIEQKHGKLRFANFRSKRLGYHVSVMEERFESGKTQIGSARTNLMSKCFFQNAADRPICYECPFKTVSRCSDITIFDGWHASEYIPGLKDDDKGYTVILVQSERGKKALSEYRDLFNLYEINVERAISLDGRMAINSVKRPQIREEFYSLLQEYGIEKTVEKIFPITKKDYVVEDIKVIMKKLGILSMVKALKKS